MRKLSNSCASCRYYDGLADACEYRGLGCPAKRPEKQTLKPSEPPPVNSCRGCRYLDRHSGDCKYPGLGCVHWKRDTS